MTIRNTQNLIIEFTGSPNSGKTTLIHNLAEALERDGLKVKVVQEDAEIVPKTIPKKTRIRNVWITFGQLQSLLEILYDSEYDVILLDRGYYDALFWAHFLYTQNICSTEECDSLVRILSEMNNTFSLLPDYLFILDVSIEESLKRRCRQSALPPTLTNEDFLSSYKKELTYFSKIDSKHEYLDTTNLSVFEVTMLVHKKIINLLS